MQDPLLPLEATRKVPNLFTSMIWTVLAVRRVCGSVLTMGLRDTHATTNKMPLWYAKVPVITTRSPFPLQFVRKSILYYPACCTCNIFCCCKPVCKCLPAAVTVVQSNCSDGDVRLEGGSNEYEGRVEICINQAWGTICSGSTYSRWGVTDGRVVCKQLGHQQFGKFMCAWLF